MPDLIKVYTCRPRPAVFNSLVVVVSGRFDGELRAELHILIADRHSNSGQHMFLPLAISGPVPAECPFVVDEEFMVKRAEEYAIGHLDNECLLRYEAGRKFESLLDLPKLQDAELTEISAWWLRAIAPDAIKEMRKRSESKDLRAFLGQVVAMEPIRVRRL